jgi:DNA mismatch endonuclease (patch repair protein)
VFCDGDFWHGRDIDLRLTRLARGHNASYWVEKIRTNVARDQATTKRLSNEGWHVVRLWETDIIKDPPTVAALVVGCLQNRQASLRQQQRRTNDSLRGRPR